MGKYTIAIEETVVSEFEVAAENQEKALNIAREKYNKCEFVLDTAEVQYKQMAIVKPHKENVKWIEF